MAKLKEMYCARSSDTRLLIYSGGNCTEILPGCMTIWRTRVEPVYLIMVNGLLQPDQLQVLCRCVRLAVNSLSNSDLDRSGRRLRYPTI